jgi:quinol monooxygenase YgiN
MSLHAVAHFHVLPGRGGEAEALLAPVVEPTLREDGCIVYRLHQDVEDGDHLVFIEEWRDVVSLDAHLARSHVTTMLAAVEPLLSRPIEAYRLAAQ